MIDKVVRVLYNAVRFIGTDSYRNLLAVEPSTHINISKSSKLTIGKKFRARFHVEINTRDSATVIIGDNVFVNSGCIITAREKIVIGNDTILGPNIVIYDNDHIIRNGIPVDNEFITEPVVIGKNVWIGAGTVILKGSSIGDNCVIAAGSIVKGKIADNSLFVQKRSKELTALQDTRV